MMDLLRQARETARNIVPVLQRRQFGVTSFSQEGEDRVLGRVFEFRSQGFYVDVGAHHPYRFSNTMMFYQRGWKGINIDAMPGSMARFRKLRPRDINLEIGIGTRAETAAFYVFNEPALNTFDKATADAHASEHWRIDRVVDVEIAPLAQVLDRHLPEATTIDFMTIDVEGRDIEVLSSNDWNRYRPKYVLAECLGQNLENLYDLPSVKYLDSIGYAPFAKTVNTFFFVDKG